MQYSQESAELVLATSQAPNPPLDKCLLRVLELLRGKIQIPFLRPSG